MEDLLGNQNQNKKHRLEERAKEFDLWKKMLKGCIKDYLKNISSLKKDKYLTFEIKNRELYYKDKPDKPLTHNKGTLRTVGEIEKYSAKKKASCTGFRRV